MGDPTAWADDELCRDARNPCADSVDRPGALDPPLSVEIAKRFVYRIDAMPVVIRDGALLAIISYVDVLRTIA